MHKIEELYWKEQFIDDSEISLLEPECIITDSTKNEITLFKVEDGKTAGPVHSLYLGAANDLNFSAKNDIEDCLTVTAISNDETGTENESVCKSNLYNDTVIANAFIDTSNAYIENIQMHSVFTPEKRYKPKEVFTQCHFCGKYVIIRMSPETGVYSKCTHCFNTPFSSGNETVFDKLGTSFSIVDLNVPKKPEVRVRKGAAVQETPPHGPSRADGSFKCGHCGKLFTRNWYLKQHIKLHSNEKPFACDHCDKRFLNSSNLKQHMRTHSIEYRCCVCNKTCISQAALKEHTMKHDTDEAKKSSARTRTEKAEDLRVQRLHCNFCKQTFVDDRRLKEHIQTHTRETPYHCDKCDKAFRYNSTLMKHMKLHDGSAMFSFQLKQVSRVNKNASGLSTSTRQSGFTSPVQTAR